MGLSKFSLGKVVATQGVVAEISSEDINEAIGKYVKCDWGILCAEDKQLNEEAILNGDRIFAHYKSSNGIAFYIITESDRSYTTILLPEEY